MFLPECTDVRSFHIPPSSRVAAALAPGSMMLRGLRRRLRKVFSSYRINSLYLLLQMLAQYNYFIFAHLDFSKTMNINKLHYTGFQVSKYLADPLHFSKDGCRSCCSRNPVTGICCDAVNICLAASCEDSVVTFRDSYSGEFL